MHYRNLGLFTTGVVLTIAASSVWVAYLNAGQVSRTPEVTNTTNPSTITKEIMESTDTVVSFEFDSAQLSLNDSIDINIKLDSETPLQTLSLSMGFDPAVIRVNSIAGTGVFDLYLGDKVDTISGHAQITGAAVSGKTVSKDPTFARINISRIAEGKTELKIANPSSKTSSFNPYTQAVVSPDLSYSVPVRLLKLN